MPDIRIVPLGAGQDVGRSCILVSIGSKNVMFDCGMHMGYQDARRFPDFNYITGGDQVRPKAKIRVAFGRGYLPDLLIIKKIGSIDNGSGFIREIVERFNH